MSEAASGSSGERCRPKVPKSYRQSPKVVQLLEQALRNLDLVNDLHAVTLDLGGDGVLLRDEPAFHKLLSSPSTC
jgi:hypothetical protein